MNVTNEMILSLMGSTLSCVLWVAAWYFTAPFRLTHVLSPFTPYFSFGW